MGSIPTTGVKICISSFPCRLTFAQRIVIVSDVKMPMDQKVMDKEIILCLMRMDRTGRESEVKGGEQLLSKFLQSQRHCQTLPTHQ